MKRLFLLLLTSVLLLSLLPSQITAASQEKEFLEIIKYEDGSYLEISIETIQLKASGSVTKTKNYIYHNTDGTSAWKISLTGSFTYNGISATCTASSCNVTIYNSNWYLISKSASKSGSTAYGTATLGRRFLGITIEQVTHNLTLTCDKDGNVS